MNASPNRETSPEGVAALERMNRLVRERPWVAVAAGAATGLALGSLVFSKFARLAFVATAGVVVHELWHREGAFDLQTVFGQPPAGGDASAGRAERRRRTS